MNVLERDFFTDPEVLQDPTPYYANPKEVRRADRFEQFATAVRRVADGGSALDPAVVSELVGRKRRDDPIEQLTAREREVLELMAEGRSNQAIAERLFVTLRAVEKHVTSIFTKLGLPASTDDHRRVLAVLAFLRA